MRKRTKPGARVIVFEPAADLYALSSAESDFSETLDDRRIQFVVGDQVRHFFDERPRGNCQETDKFLWIEWPAALREHGSAKESQLHRNNTEIERKIEWEHSSWKSFESCPR